MLKNNILAKLMQGGQTDARLFPWTKKQPEEQIEYAATDITPTPATPPPYAQPVNDDPAKPSFYARPVPLEPMPTNQPLESLGPAPKPADGWSRDIIDTTVDPKARKARPDFQGTQTQIDLQNANWDYENPEDKDQGWKGRIKEAISNFLYGMSHAGPDTDWKAALALGGIGAAGGLAKKTWNEQREAGAKIPYLRQKEAYESKQASDASDRAYRDAQTASIPIDDANRRLSIETQQRANEERVRTGALKSVVGLKYFDPKNPAHAAQAATAGLDPSALEGWDDRNPVTKQVAGTTYVYDRKDNSFKPSNLPIDESATLTDYQVKMPNGEQRSFKVAQKDAARFATQMEVLGAQIAAADRRQVVGNEHQLRMEKIKQDYRLAAEAYTKKLEEAKAEQDQARRLVLQQEAGKMQQDAIRLRAQLDDN